MSANARHRHLAAMDIDEYRPRALPAPSLLLQEPQRPVAWVGVEGESDLSLDPAHPAAALLLKILAATGFAPDRFAICRVGVPPPTVPEALPQIWFSRRAIATTASRLVLPELSQMLQDPAFKQQAWKQLKPFLTVLGPP